MWESLFPKCSALFSTAVSDELKELRLQGFLPMTGTGWPIGGACLPATLMAVRHVNERTGLLDGYNLTYSWADTKCNAGEAAFQMFKSIYQPPTKIMLLGCACSKASEATAQVSHMYNLTQISYATTSPILSVRKRFPNFFRMDIPDHVINPAKIAMLREFNWKKVATINQAIEYHSMVIDDFVQSVEGTEITIISQEIFQHDPFQRVQNLKKRDARIIISACNEDKARMILCAGLSGVLSLLDSKKAIHIPLQYEEPGAVGLVEGGTSVSQAYKSRLYGSKIVWIFSAFSPEFWRPQDDVSCSEDEMIQAVEGAFFMGSFFRNTRPERGIAGLTVSEFENLYKQEDMYNITQKQYEFCATFSYDHIWVAALALNCSETYLRSSGHEKSLDEFTYQESDINDVILACMYNISFTGVSGRIAYGAGSDPITRNVKIDRLQGGQRSFVGTYVTDEDVKHFEWKPNALKWEDNNIPRDSTYSTSEEIVIPLWLYVFMSTCTGIGMLLAVGLFAFNIVHRNNRIVKLSSPYINNILLFGCVLTYITVVLKTTESETAELCKARAFFFSIGFTVAFGALFSKTWRVYKIFTNKKMQKITIKDQHLVGLILGLVGGIVLLVVIWEIVSPQQILTRELTKEVYIVGNDAVVRPFVRICSSKFGVYFSWAIYIAEGTLLAFGAFLAWETRRVKMEELNDSHQIAICVYNTIILSAFGLTVALILEDKVVIVYGVTSGCIILGTTLTQVIVFFPKVVAVIKQTQPSTTENASQNATFTTSARYSGAKESAPSTSTQQRQ